MQKGKKITAPAVCPKHHKDVKTIKDRQQKIELQIVRLLAR